MFAAATGIESQNIVGYSSKTTDGTKYPIFGASFLPNDGSETYKLGSLVPSNISADDDLIQVINSTTLGPDNMYLYVDKATADYLATEDGEKAGAYDNLIGWWDATGNIGDEASSANDVPVAEGDGFLGFFASGNEITFNLPSSLYTGE